MNETDATLRPTDDTAADALPAGLRTGPLMLRLVVVLFASHYPTEFVVEHFLDGTGLLEVVVEATLLGVISGGLVWGAVLVPLRRAMGAEHDVRIQHEQQLVAETMRQRFAGRLARGSEMAETEDQLLTVLRRALDAELGGAEAALMMSDGAGSLTTTLDTGNDCSARRCGVVEPRACPAIRSGNAVVFGDPQSIDSCPQLASTDTDVGAVCVPMQAGGRAVGVLTLPMLPTGPDIDVAAVTSLVATVGRRLGMIRVMAQTSHRAATDSLTGLRNRRAGEEAANEVLRSGQRAAIVLADLDRFKLLNDTEGHAAGDQALRAYAHALTTVLRPTDVIARHGGEEFLLVMPDADTAEAERAVERLRTHLAGSLLHASAPAFTASYGITDTSTGRDLPQLLEQADRALYRAKRDGRDRSVVFTTEQVAHDDAAVDWERVAEQQ